MEDRDDEDIKILTQIKKSIAKMEKLNKEQEKALKNIIKNKEEENISNLLSPVHKKEAKYGFFYFDIDNNTFHMLHYVCKNRGKDYGPYND